jgi:hypothetical protein
MVNKKSNAKTQRLFCLALFFLWMFTANCSLDKNDSGNEKLFAKTVEEGEMRINLGKINLTIPRGFADGNIYAFNNEDRTEKVEVWRGFYSPAEKDFPTIIKEYRARLSSDYPGLSPTIVKEGETTLAGLPAHEFVVEVRHDEGVIFNHVIVARDSSNSYIELDLESKNNDPRAKEDFVHVVKSAELTRNEQDNKPNTPAPANFSRRYAGALMLDVPNQLTRHNLFEFERKMPDESGGTIRLTVKIFESGEPIPESMEEEANRSKVLGNVTLADSKEITTEEYKAKIQRYTTTVNELGMPPRQTPLMIAELQIADGTTVRLQGRAPVAFASEMKAGFDELLSGVHPNKGK